MRSDRFFGKKSVHVKLTKEVHTALREKLFRFGITMQDLFQEAAEMAVLEGTKSDRLLERISKKKLKAELEKPLRQFVRAGEIDAETLYNLLEDTNDDATPFESATEE